jgi:hypothetical protein
MKRLKLVDLAKPVLRKKKWNVNHLAKAMGVNSGYLYQLFNDRPQKSGSPIRVTRFTASRIATALQLPEDYFFDCDDVVDKPRRGSKRKTKRKYTKRALAHRESPPIEQYAVPEVEDDNGLDVVTFQVSELFEAVGKAEKLLYWMGHFRARGFVLTEYGPYVDKDSSPDKDYKRFLLRGERITKKISGEVK